MLTSEATGDALNDSVYSLAHLRMLKHLTQFLDLSADASWQTIQAAAKAMDYESLCRDLIQAAGIQVILFDDGIANEQCHPISWHNGLTPLPNKRIVRIEAVFESIIHEKGTELALKHFVDEVKRAVDDPEVVGFKSVAAYRSGLDIEPNVVDDEVVIQELPKLKRGDRSRPRVDQPKIIRWLVNTTLSIISGTGKPLQFHTGLGDNDISLVKADASLLQPLIKTYPNASFVLLHSGYPYARQAGYLATVYSNVYLDFGLAIPLLSGDGQRNMLRQLMELCPTNKLLWSSDAAFHPERFYLAALQTREALSEVLADYIDRSEISYEQGVEIAKRIFFHNANKLYSLGVEYVELDPKTIIKGVTQGSIEGVGGPEPKSVGAAENLGAAPEHIPRSLQLSKEAPNRTLKESISLIKSRGIKFIRVVWVDYVNLIRYRVVPINHFESLVGTDFMSSSNTSSPEQLVESGLNLIRAGLVLGVQDGLPSGVSTSGDFDLKPDFSTMWKAPFMPTHAYMMGRFFEKPHSGNQESAICPRTILQRVIQRAERESKSKFLVGFETEFILLDQNDKPASGGAWSTTQKLQCGSAADCVHDIAQSIIDAGIKLEMYHAESAQGQYEVVTGHLPPMQAADTLVATREIIYNVARKHGYKATLAPRVFSAQAGSASHVHVSVQSPRSGIPSNHPDIPSLPSDLASFMAGLLNHLPSVCVFTLPVDASYARVVDGAWSGGSWVCWGRENKEAPLRLCGSGSGFNVELKAQDGIANPYLALAAILAAGLTGLVSEQTLEMRNCVVIAAQLTEERRQEMHITTRMPTQSAVFEPDLDKRTEYINSWLPLEAWKLYKAVRQLEREQLSPTSPAPDGYDMKAESSRLCQNYY